MNITKKIIIFMTFLALANLSGCSGLVSQKSGHQAVSSSLVDFLYPNKSARVTHKEEIPLLKLPVKVGLAFLPSQNWSGNAIAETNKIKLLNKVKASFGQHQFIEGITIIPSVYLRGARGSNGFDVMDRVARLHNIDVIALVSYDQVTQSFHNNASLLYWTIVGMYVIPGNENTVQTFVDTAVFDIRSRKMLLRAPGVNSLSKHSTAIGVDSVMAEKSQQGFNLAFDDMIKNLDIELKSFKVRAKEGRIATIEHRPGYSSGGSFNIWLLLLFGLLALVSKINNRIKVGENYTFYNSLSSL